jgi:hypothetical protein
LFGESSEPWICGETPGIVGAPNKGRVAPPLASNHENTARIASGVEVCTAPFGLMLGPW